MMRLALLAVLLALATAAPASAQALQSYGVKIGGTESNVEVDLPSDEELARRGVSWMAFAQWNVPGPVALVTEAGVVDRGYARMVGSYPAADVYAETVALDPPTRLDRRMRYVSVAALARLPVVSAGPVSAYAVAGPRMNTLIGRRGEDSDGILAGYDYRSVTWDATAGIGVEATRWLPLLVEARYNAGLTDAFSGELWGDEAYHRAVDVMVGIRF